jgi:hypothetical protein
MRKLTTTIVTTGLAAIAVAGCTSAKKTDGHPQLPPASSGSSSQSAGGNGGGAGISAVGFVKAATDATRQAQTVKIKETGTILGQQFTADGALRFSGNTVDADVKEHSGLGEIEVIYVQDTFYIKGIEKGDPGKPWTKDSSLSKTIGPLVKKADPSQMLQLLTTTSNLTPLGTETVNGVHTTHYSVQIDLTRLAQHDPDLAKLVEDAMQMGAKTQALDVWIDDQKRPARLRTTVEAPNPVDKSKKLTFSQTVDYSDWGAPVTIQAPPADQVAER